jgi:hypothetical protein
VKSYRVDNERIMKDREEILEIFNMFQKQAKKDSSTGQEASAIQVTASKSHRRKDGHGNCCNRY